jgi:hypothetical protein
MRLKSLYASRLALILACTLGMVAGSAVADTAQAPGTSLVKYIPEDFKNFQCSTALDIVSHVPGFVFSTGNNVRGFAGAAGNVLIDGQRPASKVGLDVELNNIAISQIDHIEVITGGAPGIDMQGYQQIVNVVRKSSDKAHQSIDIYDKVFTDGPNKPAIEYSYNRNYQGKSLDIDLQLFQFRDNGLNNTQRYSYYPGQSVPDHTYLDQRAGGRGNQAKIDYSRPFLGGKLSFNGFYNPIYYTQRIVYTGATRAYEHFNLNETVSEWGVQYERPLGKTVTLDLNVLQHYDRQNSVDVYTDAGGSSDNLQLYQPIEHILSAKLTWQPNTRMSFKLGGEKAFNALDNSTLYTQGGQSQNLPFSTIRVEEQRAEYFLTGDWQAMPKLSLEGSLKVETSTIRVPQSGRSQSFVYPKPEVQIVWSPTDKIKLSWRSERIVGQLNFNDFASSVSLSTSVVKSGNPNIVPQTEWAHTATLDYSFWGKGALSLVLMHEALENTLDELAIVTADGIDNADGNIGKGRRDSAHIILDLPTDKLMVKDGELKIDYTVRSTEVTDPILGVKRAISNQNPETYVVTFQQHLTPIHSSWGLEIDSLNIYQQFNAQEYYHYRSSDWLALWFEYKAPHGVTYGAVWQNPMGRHDSYVRDKWTGLRGLSPLSVEERDYSLARPWINLHIKKEW